MDAENESGKLLQTAQQKAEAVAQVYQNTDEFQIIIMIFLGSTKD